MRMQGSGTLAGMLCFALGCGGLDLIEPHLTAHSCLFVYVRVTILHPQGAPTCYNGPQGA